MIGFGQVRPWSCQSLCNNDDDHYDNHGYDDHDDNDDNVDINVDDKDDDNENDDDTFITVISLSTLYVSTSLGSAFLQTINNEYFAKCSSLLKHVAFMHNICHSSFYKKGTCQFKDVKN